MTETEIPKYLSKSDFMRVPTSLKEFKVNDNSIIDRSNFTSFLIKMFAISRGSGVFSGLFLKWYEQKSGFDFKTTFDNFLQAGGWDTLSSDEQNRFMKAFKSASGHGGFLMETVTKAPKESLEGSIAETIDPEITSKLIQKVKLFEKRNGNLGSMSYSDLVRGLNNFEDNRKFTLLI